jgi:hypothetical protein
VGRWNEVSTGQVAEFRASTGNAPQVWRTPLPTLAVIYRRRLSRLEYDYRVMMLQAIRREALGAITDEGLAAAGYTTEDAFARFRRDWTLHEHRRFSPLQTVTVFTVRPVVAGDRELAGRSLVAALYEEFENAVDTVRTVITEPGAGSATRHPRREPRRVNRYGIPV